MSDTQPNYPVEACNDNGPYPQDVAIRWQSYEGSANPPTLADITIAGMTLTVTLGGQQPSTLHVITPGDESGNYPQITTDADGNGSTTYTYAAPGPYTVVVARDAGGSQTVIASVDVLAVAAGD